MVISNQRKIIKKVFKLISDKVEYSVNRHPRYDCPYDDLKEISRVGVVSAYSSFTWAKRLKARQIYRNSKYYECNILFRKHKNNVRELNDLWWKEFIYLPYRDQPGFRVAFEANKKKILFKDLDLGNTRLGSNFYATAIVHNKRKPIIKRLIVRLLNIILGYEYLLKVFVSFIPKAK